MFFNIKFRFSKSVDLISIHSLKEYTTAINILQYGNQPQISSKTLYMEQI